MTLLKVMNIIMMLLIMMILVSSQAVLANNGVRIVVTFDYLKYDVEPLLCPNDIIYSLVPSGVDPHDYELRPNDIKILKSSDIIISTAHAPFEIKIRELYLHGELGNATLIEVPYIGGMKIYMNPLLNKPNLHAVTYDPNNLIILIKSIVNTLIKLRPECKRIYVTNMEKVVSKIENMISQAPRLNLRGIGLSPLTQYAVSWLGVNITYLLIKEHGVPILPQDLKVIEELARSRKVDVVIVVALSITKNSIELAYGSDVLLDLARKYSLGVIYVPSPLMPNSTISKLVFILNQAKSVAINVSRGVKEVSKVNVSEVIKFLTFPLALIVFGALAYVFRMHGKLLSKVTLTLLVGGALYSSIVISVLYDVKWVLVFVCAGVSYGVLSSLVAARRLYFLAGASPHAALLAAVLSIALTSIFGISTYFWALLLGIALLYIAGFMIYRGLDADIATSVFVSLTSALSVIAIYYILTNFRYSADVLSIIVGNPLLISWFDVIFLIALTLAIALPILLTYYENVYLGIDREDAITSGSRLWLYDLITFTALALATVGIIKVVGFVLEHVLILLPGSIAIASSRNSKEALLTSLIVSLSMALLGLNMASIFNMAPSGMIGLLLLIIYVMTLALRRK